MRISLRNHPCKNISLPATNIVVMPVDIDYTTKLSEEQRKFFSNSTITKTTENLNNFRSTISTVPYQLRKRLRSKERQAHTFQRMSQDSRRKVCRKQQRGSFSTVLFFKFLYMFDRNVHRDGAIFSMHVQHMIVIQRRTGAPHSVTPSAAGRGTCSRSLQSRS